MPALTVDGRQKEKGSAWITRGQLVPTWIVLWSRQDRYQNWRRPQVWIRACSWAAWIEAIKRTSSAPWMGSMGLGKTASPAAFLAGGAWPSPEPLPPCQPSSGWLLILDVVCRQRGLQPAPLLGPQREVSGACRSRSTHGRPRSEAAAWIRGPPGPKDYQRVSRANGEQPQRQSNFSLIYNE